VTRLVVRDGKVPDVKTRSLGSEGLKVSELGL